MLPRAAEEDEKSALLEAARHLCQESRVVLTSLRGGPPNVARGELAQDLMELRTMVKAAVSNESFGASGRSSSTTNGAMSTNANANATNTLRSTSTVVLEESEEGAVLVQTPTQPTDALLGPATHQPPPKQDVGYFARPFLAVVVDPRAAGPHTLVALRALFRLLQQHSLVPAHNANNNPFVVALEPLTKGVLACKFEQTDAGADEAVEMAIADLLALITQIDLNALAPHTLMEAFNTVFVTRNTFVHSPALCYHFEDVLHSMLKTVFSQLPNTSALLVLEFLVNQLLHTPLVDGEAAMTMDESVREAQAAHDATRVLCLRLTRCALQTGWGATANSAPEITTSNSTEERTLLNIIQDDLCLSLLMTGQAIWAYHDASTHISPGLISLEVLSEICATLSTLWNRIPLRPHLVSQFETIFTGFYQRALVLLRKCQPPYDSMTFNANLAFDAELEVILESLVDILCLHDHSNSIADGDGGALETLFATYDCHMKRSDVAAGLMVELCRCCGGKVDEEGQAIVTPASSFLGTPQNTQTPGTPKASAEQQAAASLDAGSTTASTNTDNPVEAAQPSPDTPPPRSPQSSSMEAFRPVPPHLKELCAEALVGAMKCLFRDDHASQQTLAERSHRTESIMRKPRPPRPSMRDLARAESGCSTLRDVKSKKRLIRLAAHLFNKKPSKGIQFLVSSNLVPNPVTPASVASFLRNGIVVGLDKKAVGAYLGEMGKAPVAGKSPPGWERDWFHKEVLAAYCNLFKFGRQSLLDGLRMFLAAFRLPGEAQQIDRILQAFADSCGRMCDESSKLFSQDPKRASDAAYLLSFSIIMLNTDQHNDNIREDRKMTRDDFVRNNTDYGKDITERGKELPREFLEGIYESIREEEIRTEGEGADGCMTVERWKDVLRGSNEDVFEDLPTEHDANDLTELVLEHVWMPIVSAMGALWGVDRFEEQLSADNPSSTNRMSADMAQNGMLNSQGARLAMDMAIEMLTGVRNLGRIDIFQKLFHCVCVYTGLLGDYTTDATERTWQLANSVECQSAVVVVMKIARDASQEIGVDGWKHVWAIIFELRDLKMLGGGGGASAKRNILKESEPDLLGEDARRDWAIRLIKGETDPSSARKGQRSSGYTGVFGVMGRVLFGGDEEVPGDDLAATQQHGGGKPTLHGKECLFVWDELAPSDTEDEEEPQGEETMFGFPMGAVAQLSDGAMFENQLIHEDLLISQQTEMPVTGLERADDTLQFQRSPRARVRKRLSKACDFSSIVTESRFMDMDGIQNMLKGLLGLISVVPPPSYTSAGEIRESQIDPLSFSQREALNTLHLEAPISPASQAFAEVLVCEVALKNRDRLGALWKDILKDHYVTRLRGVIVAVPPETELPKLKRIDPGIEKCLTGLLRISLCAVQRDGIANDILASWKRVIPAPGKNHDSPHLRLLDKHTGEGLWRICRDVEGLSQLGSDGWEGLLSLASWCAKSGFPSARSAGAGLSEDDPALNTFRSLHSIITAADVPDRVLPFAIDAIRALIICGEHRNNPKLSTAGLDLLRSGLTIIESRALAENDDSHELLWQSCWRPTVEGMAEAAAFSSRSNIRQHALSMLTDSFLDKPGGSIPVKHLCGALNEVCAPLAASRILDLRNALSADGASNDEIKIELELWISLIFKPLRHHLKKIVEDCGIFLSLWKTILAILEELLNSKPGDSGSNDLLLAMMELANEHLRNAIMVLVAFDVLKSDSESPGDITAVTWESVSRMQFCKGFVDEWKEAATQGAAE